MAINKVVNTSVKSHGAMNNVLEYVLQDEKIKEGYVTVTGPYNEDEIDYKKIYQSWIEEKRLWDKDNGRMYAHNIISFHKDEKVAPCEVLDIGKEFADKFFDGHQCVISVHQDKDHLHCHIVTNSVSYIDGMKLHQTKHDLQKQKDFTNNLCLERGLTVAEKGHHFDGSEIAQGEITSWSRDKYSLLTSDSKKSYVTECAIAIVNTLPNSRSRDDFISGMQKLGWAVKWTDNRKHIVYTNENGDKVRDTNIEKTFIGMKANKEALEYEFTRQNEIKSGRINSENQDAELDRYYREIESAVGDSRTTGKAIGSHKNSKDATGRAKNRIRRRDSGSHIREFKSKENTERSRQNNTLSRQANRSIQEKLRVAERLCDSKPPKITRARESELSL